MNPLAHSYRRARLLHRHISVNAAKTAKCRRNQKFITSLQIIGLFRFFVYPWWLKSGGECGCHGNGQKRRCARDGNCWEGDSVFMRRYALAAVTSNAAYFLAGGVSLLTQNDSKNGLARLFSPKSNAPNPFHLYFESAVGVAWREMSRIRPVASNHR